MSKDRVMLDIETLGLDIGSAILSIGAVRFDEDGLGDTFYREVSLKDCQKNGLKIDAGTLEWWMEQDENAQRVLSGGDMMSEVFIALRKWYDDADEVWANSPAFDCVQLEYAGSKLFMDMPWEYDERRDFRTAKNLVEVDPDVDMDGTEHDALDDAKYQAIIASRILRELEDE